ncbi:MAG: glycosyltransferase [Candidatus Competibacteraceae bacterium]
MIAIPSPLFPNAGLRRLRVGIVTETYGPEVNGVAMTVGRLVEGLLARGHAVQLIRPRQHPRDDPHRDGALDVWPVAGAAIPFYRDLRIGFPAGRLLLERWRQAPPDVVHIVTEGPLGHSALAVARRLRLRVFSGFHTNFHAYSRHYGMGLLARSIVAYLRRFHNRTDCTLVPTEELATELRTLGFHRLRVLARGVDTRLFDPAHRDPALRRSWGASPSDPVALYVAGWRRKKICN